MGRTDSELSGCSKSWGRLAKRRHSVMGYFDEENVWAGDYPEDHKKRIDALLSMIPVGVECILDLGCGSGALADPASGLGFDVVACDLSTTALAKVCTKKCRGSVHEMMFADRSFDLVVVAEVLEHIPDAIYAQALKEVARITKRYILLSVPYEEVLAGGSVKCPSCGFVFHAYGHLRSYHENDLERLFPGMELVGKRFLGVRKRYNNLELYLRHRVGKYYSQESRALCPACGTRNRTSRFPPVSALLAEVMCRVHTLIRRPPSWFLGLYQTAGKGAAA